VIANDYRRLILRDVAGIARQLEAYPAESEIWNAPRGIGNPPGNLTLHVAGNLQHFIGHVLGGSNYRRDRDAEFARSEVPLAELLAELDAASRAVDATLANVTDARLAEPYPLEFGEIQLGTGQFLAHLCGHLAYHLGQIDYHRRITTGDGAIPGIQGIESLQN
jgi:uncharacterized damage-inducible protein DinB